MSPSNFFKIKMSQVTIQPMAINFSYIISRQLDMLDSTKYSFSEYAQVDEQFDNLPPFSGKSEQLNFLTPVQSEYQPLTFYNT